MSSGQQPDRGHAGWAQALNAAGSFAVSLTPLRADRNATVESIRTALLGVGQRQAAMIVLGQLDSDYTEAVLPELLAAALSHRDTQRVRRLLGQLPHREAAMSVPPAVWRQLAETPDEDAYRRMAELLDHLGLADALRTLISRAGSSPDPAVREVTEQFHAP